MKGSLTRSNLERADRYVKSDKHKSFDHTQIRKVVAGLTHPQYTVLKLMGRVQMSSLLAKAPIATETISGRRVSPTAVPTVIGT